MWQDLLSIQPRTNSPKFGVSACCLPALGSNKQPCVPFIFALCEDEPHICNAQRVSRCNHLHASFDDGRVLVVSFCFLHNLSKGTILNQGSRNLFSGNVPFVLQVLFKRSGKLCKMHCFPAICWDSSSIPAEHREIFQRKRCDLS